MKKVLIEYLWIFSITAAILLVALLLFPEKKNRLEYIEERLDKEYKDQYKIILVPNITNICYGRGVGYKIEEIILEEDIQKISATKIREEMRKDGRL